MNWGEAEPSPKHVALVAAPVYVALHFLSAIASQKAHRVESYCGSTPRALRMVWILASACFLVMSIASLGGAPAIVVAAFLFIYCLQNLWRPMVISELSRQLNPSFAAGWLSAENLLRRLGAAALLPFLGYLVDWAGRVAPEQSLLPVGVVGLFVSVMFVGVRRRHGA